MEHIGNILGLCRGIFWIAAEAKAYRRRCRGLAERIRAMEELVVAIKGKGASAITQDVNRALWKLSMTLTAAHELVKKCARTKFLNPLKCQSEFSSVTEDLRDTYHVLAGAAHSKHRMNQEYVWDDDDDDDDWDVLGALGASRYPAAAASRAQPATAVYTAKVGLTDDALYYEEAFFLSQ